MKISEITKISELGHRLSEYYDSIIERGYKVEENYDIKFIERNNIILKDLEDDVFDKRFFCTNYFGKNPSLLKQLMEKQAKYNGTISEYEKEYDDPKFDIKGNPIKWYGEM